MIHSQVLDWASLCSVEQTERDHVSKVGGCQDHGWKKKKIRDSWPELVGAKGLRTDWHPGNLVGTEMKLLNVGDTYVAWSFFFLHSGRSGVLTDSEARNYPVFMNFFFFWAYFLWWDTLLSLEIGVGLVTVSMCYIRLCRLHKGGLTPPRSKCRVGSGKIGARRTGGRVIWGWYIKR